MKKYEISRYGLPQTIVNFTGLPQSTINDWISRPSHPNYDFCHELMQELMKAQETVLSRWSTSKRLAKALENYKPRKPRQKRK